MGAWLLLLGLFFVPWVARIYWPHKIQYLEVAITMAITAVITGGIYAAGHYGQTSDVEIWSGEITNKDRVHGSYVRTYECRCRDVCSGSGKNRSCSRTCDTCFEDRYTVKWTARSNIQDFTIESLDSGYRSVYSTPDPQRYTSIRVGDPVAAARAYTNYIKAVPESLFHAKISLSKQYADKIPPYPSQIYDYYNINRVLSVGVPVPDLPAWNTGVSQIMRKLGPQRHANVVIVFVNDANSSYVHALEGAWLGGKKNDVVVVVGTTSYPTIEWVRIMSWTDKEIFKVQLRDELQALGTVDRSAFLGIIEKHTMATFVRKSMKDFEYLKEEIEPPLWVVVLAGVLGLLAALGSTYFFYRNDLH